MAYCTVFTKGYSLVPRDPVFPGDDTVIGLLITKAVKVKQIRSHKWKNTFQESYR